MSYRFEWDPHKAAANRKKHGVSFDEASTVFDDPLAVTFEDDLHSTDETRELLTGRSISGQHLMISFTERPGGIIRLISARPATQKECRDYEQNVHF
ncbi:MAG: BrnT family toxin [Caldilineae bacterium]|nr:BrnT family toxin [Anaerolineae bacterium]MCB0256676.1 BrnT family toxin [Anaerolineae bacterium]MCB9154471.1 BrnT family toxin [Caldilineae bacterium]